MKHSFYPRSIHIVLMATWLCLPACSSDDPQPVIEDPPDEEPGMPEPEDPDSKFFKLVRIENLGFDTTQVDDDPTAPKPTVFFSLEEGVIKAPAYAKTNRWDLAFGHLYNSFLSGNNGNDPKNYGSGANSAGGICILEQNFNDVASVPQASQFLTGRDAIGTDDAGTFGTGIGWYLYDFGGTIRGDGSYEKQHVAYALADTRTVVVRTARGHFAKIRMISCYKDAFTADQWFRDTPHMFYTFEYVMVPAGSTRFETR